MCIIFVWESEYSPVGLEEFLEHEILINHLLDFFRQLPEYRHITLILKGHILIHGPFICKEGFNFPFQIQINWDVVVEFLNGTKEL